MITVDDVEIKRESREEGVVIRGRLVLQNYNVVLNEESEHVEAKITEIKKRIVWEIYKDLIEPLKRLEAEVFRMSMFCDYIEHPGEMDKIQERFKQVFDLLP